MQIVKLSLDFYRVTAYVYAVIVTAGKEVVIYDGETSFRMQPDIGIQPCGPVTAFCRNWARGQAIGIADGTSDIDESLRQAISLSIKRIYREKFTEHASVVQVDAEIIEIQEQEIFQMQDLHKDFKNGTMRFYFKKG